MYRCRCLVGRQPINSTCKLQTHPISAPYIYQAVRYFIRERESELGVPDGEFACDQEYKKNFIQKQFLKLFWLVRQAGFYKKLWTFCYTFLTISHMFWNVLHLHIFQTNILQLEKNFVVITNKTHCSSVMNFENVQDNEILFFCVWFFMIFGKHEKSTLPDLQICCVGPIWWKKY